MKYSNTTLILSPKYNVLFNSQTVGSVKHSSQTSTIYLKIQKRETRKHKIYHPSSQAHLVLGRRGCEEAFPLTFKKNYS